MNVCIIKIYTYIIIKSSMVDNTGDWKFDEHQDF